MNVIFGKDEEIQEIYDTHEKNMKKLSQMCKAILNKRK